MAGHLVSHSLDYTSNGLCLIMHGIELVNNIYSQGYKEPIIFSLTTTVAWFYHPGIMCKAYCMFHHERSEHCKPSSVEHNFSPTNWKTPIRNIVRQVWIIFGLVENRLCICLWRWLSTSTADVRKPADRPTIAASINRDLAKIQEWHNHWSMLLNPNKTKTSAISRSRNMKLPLECSTLECWMGSRVQSTVCCFP